MVIPKMSLLVGTQGGIGRPVRSVSAVITINYVVKVIGVVRFAGLHVSLNDLRLYILKIEEAGRTPKICIQVHLDRGIGIAKVESIHFCAEHPRGNRDDGNGGGIFGSLGGV